MGVGVYITVQTGTVNFVHCSTNANDRTSTPVGIFRNNIEREYWRIRCELSEPHMFLYFIDRLNVLSLYLTGYRVCIGYPMRPKTRQTT